MIRNNTNFPFFLQKEMKQIESKYDQNYEMLKHYQYVIYKYMIQNEYSKGLLLFMETGYGKTLTAIAIAEHFINNTNRKVVILLAKGLVDNFKKNIDKYISYNRKSNENYKNINTEEHINNNYRFVSLNSSKMFSNIMQEITNKEIIENQLKSLLNTGIINNLDNNLLIVDEAHNLFNSITNGSKNGLKLYNKIMETENIKLLFLTGTPMINYPFEIVTCMNMLNGKIRIPKTNLTTTLLSEDENDFNEFFIDFSKNTLKNSNILMNRIIGLTAYFGKKFDKKISDSKVTSMFPKQLELHIIKCPMSEYQYNLYIESRKLESLENKYSQKLNISIKQKFRKKSDIKSNSYRIRSRQISNFCLPDYAMKRTTKNKFYIKNIDNLDIDEYVKNINKYSPKMLNLLTNLKKYTNGELGVIYSTFVSVEGIELITRVLIHSGYAQYFPKNRTDKLLEEKFGQIKSNNSNQVFAVISGKVNIEDREKIIDKFTNEENKYGKYINILIFSNTGVEGLDLKAVRHVHIFEPFWNYARIVQVIARAVRYKSHIHLKDNENTVQPYIYLATEPKDMNIKKMLKNKNYYLKMGYFIEDKTTDSNILYNAMKHYKLIQKIEYLLAQSSIDCHIHKNKTIIKCKMCNPTNRELFSKTLYKQDILHDPCKMLVEEDIEVKEIKVLDKTFYYNIDKNKIPEIYEEKSGDYQIMSTSNKLYETIFKKINDIEKLEIIGGKTNNKKHFDFDSWIKRC